MAKFNKNNLLHDLKTLKQFGATGFQIVKNEGTHDIVKSDKKQSEFDAVIETMEYASDEDFIIALFDGYSLATVNKNAYEGLKIKTPAVVTVDDEGVEAYNLFFKNDGVLSFEKTAVIIDNINSYYVLSEKIDPNNIKKINLKEKALKLTQGIVNIIDYVNNNPDNATARDYHAVNKFDNIEKYNISRKLQANLTLNYVVKNEKQIKNNKEYTEKFTHTGLNLKKPYEYKILEFLNIIISNSSLPFSDIGTDKIFITTQQMNELMKFQSRTEKSRFIKRLLELSQKEFLFKTKDKGVLGGYFEYFISSLCNITEIDNGLIVEPLRPLLMDVITGDKYYIERDIDFYNNCINIEDFKMINLREFYSNKKGDTPILYTFTGLLELLQLKKDYKLNKNRTIQDLNNSLKKFTFNNIAEENKDNIVIKFRQEYMKVVETVNIIDVEMYMLG